MFLVILCFMLIAEIKCYYDDSTDYWFSSNDGAISPSYITNQRSQPYDGQSFLDTTHELTPSNPKLLIEFIVDNRRNLFAEAAPSYNHYLDKPISYPHDGYGLFGLSPPVSELKGHSKTFIGGKNYKEVLGFKTTPGCHICNHYCICGRTGDSGSVMQRLSLINYE